ncbi:MAG: metallophosphoesterase family protein [Gemmatimonadota bacterium]|nr:metallophosphoesterase family protein [Gemmatimonadota bacterium]
MLIGLISDTHGLLRADVHSVFAGVDLILHAGDVGGVEILDELALIAPVRAVYGNTDPSDHPGLVTALDFTLEGVRVHVSHGHELGRTGSPQARAAAYDADLIVYGHTHRQRVDQVGAQLVVNPGAAGACRYDLPPTVALAEIAAGAVRVRLVELSA